MPAPPCPRGRMELSQEANASRSCTVASSDAFGEVRGQSARCLAVWV